MWNGGDFVRFMQLVKIIILGPIPWAFCLKNLLSLDDRFFSNAKERYGSTPCFETRRSLLTFLLICYKNTNTGPNHRTTHTENEWWEKRKKSVPRADLENMVPNGMAAKNFIPNRFMHASLPSPPKLLRDLICTTAIDDMAVKPTWIPCRMLLLLLQIKYAKLHLPSSPPIVVFLGYFISQFARKMLEGYESWIRGQILGLQFFLHLIHEKNLVVTLEVYLVAAAA